MDKKKHVGRQSSIIIIQRTSGYFADVSRLFGGYSGVFVGSTPEAAALFCLREKSRDSDPMNIFAPAEVRAAIEVAIRKGQAETDQLRRNEMDDDKKRNILRHCRGGYLGLGFSFVSADTERSFDTLHDALEDAADRHASIIYQGLENYYGQAIFELTIKSYRKLAIRGPYVQPIIVIDIKRIE